MGLQNRNEGPQPHGASGGCWVQHGARWARTGAEEDAETPPSRPAAKIAAHGSSAAGKRELAVADVFTLGTNRPFWPLIYPSRG